MVFVLSAAALLTAHTSPSYIVNYAPWNSIACRLAATAITLAKWTFVLAAYALGTRLLVAWLQQQLLWQSMLNSMKNSVYACSNLKGENNENYSFSSA
jgi:hypothetical protein